MNELMNQQMMNTGRVAPQQQQAANGVFGQMQQQLNQAVYGNQAIMAKGNQVFGTPEMMQASVAPMEQRQVIDPLTGMPVANQQQIM